jgi:hypothetical protein
VMASDGMINMHTKIHEDWFGHSDNMKVVNLIIWESVVLVLLMRVIPYVSLEVVSDGMTCIPSFIKIDSGIKVILRLLTE